MDIETPGLSSTEAGKRSFVLRSGRITKAQQEAIDTLTKVYSISYKSGVFIDSASLFSPPLSERPLIVEIGFGMGAATADIAEALPDQPFLGIEVHEAGVGKLLMEIEKRSIKNLRVCRHDAVEVIQNMVADDSIAAFHIFFPDPWPKKRHHKRRLLQPDFIKLLAAKLRPEGYIYFVTDWEDYAQASLDFLNAEPLLYNIGKPWAPRFPWRAVTKFEARALREGRQICELVFKKGL